jgi:hypothetical protein
MALRRRSKAVEDLRLANIRDCIITEDEDELSPCTTSNGNPSLIIPRRVNEDTYDDIVTSFRKFTWEPPKIDGRGLCDYRRFVNSMALPTKEAIEPWVDWLELQLGWEKAWILENPVATKREIMRRLEGIQECDDEPLVEIPQSRFLKVHRLEIQDSLGNLRKGAISRMSFRGLEKYSNRLCSTVLLRPDHSRNPVASSENGKDEESSSLLRRKVERSTSTLGFRDVKKLRGHLSSLKKALTNPWMKRSQAVKQ